jgi:hypothetical protein
MGIGGSVRPVERWESGVGIRFAGQLETEAEAQATGRAGAGGRSGGAQGSKKMAIQTKFVLN